MDRVSRPVVRVWDPVVRIGHWALLAAFTVAYLTEHDLLTTHVWAGYVVGAIVLLRVVWGFIGPRHARFSDFVQGPVRVLTYLRDLLLLRARRHLGHSPAGGAMVIALLLSLAVTVITGVALYGAEKHAGPLKGFFAAGAPTAGVIGSARAEERASARPGKAEHKENLLEETHGFFANLTLILVILHVLGVFLAMAAHRENLIWAMITGDKRAELADPPAG